MSDDLGKKAEQKIRTWLDRPEEGYCLDRIPDQMTGQYGSKNICDFILYKNPYLYYLESKATWNDRFDFSRITDFQYDSMMSKSKIQGVFSYVIILFATQRKTVMLDINVIDTLIKSNKKSINITKQSKWTFYYKEIKTVPNNRKYILDYSISENDFF